MYFNEYQRFNFAGLRIVDCTVFNFHHVPMQLDPMRLLSIILTKIFWKSNGMTRKFP